MNEFEQPAGLGPVTGQLALVGGNVAARFENGHVAEHQRGRLGTQSNS